MTTIVEVGLGPRRYPITIGRDLLEDAATWRTAIRGRHALVVSDSNVAPLYAKRLREVLIRSPLPPEEAAAARARSAGVWVQDPHDVRSRNVQTLVLPAGEAHKNLATAARVFDALAEIGATRDACIVALGGGVVGDIAGFAAACWMRGIDFVQVPTTLLAMVDASVGGKTGVDHPAGKNLIGAFHQPCAVMADLAVLATLPNRELRAGLAEVIKTACIGDADFFAWLEGHVDALLARDPDALMHAVATCCRFKAGVVERDEREAGERALLNFGHTFGHALEAESGYAALLHGEAVAIGMVMAARLSEDLGMATAADTRRLHALLGACGLPTKPPKLDPDALLARMRLDKKNRADALRLILWRGIGHAEIVEGVAGSAVLGAIRDRQSPEDPAVGP